MNKFELRLAIEKIAKEKKALSAQNKQLEEYLYGEKCILSEIGNAQAQKLIGLDNDMHDDLRELNNIYHDMKAYEDIEQTRILGNYVEHRVLRKKSRIQKLQYLKKKYHNQKHSLNTAAYSIITALCPTIVGMAMAKLTNNSMNCGIGKIIMLIKVPLIILAMAAILPVQAVIASAAYVIYFILSMGIGVIAAKIIKRHRENKSLRAFSKLIKQEIQEYNDVEDIENIRRHNLSEIINKCEKIYNSKLERQNLQKKEQEAKKSSSEYSQKIINMLNEMKNSLVVNENAYSKKIVR